MRYCTPSLSEETIWLSFNLLVWKTEIERTTIKTACKPHLFLLRLMQQWHLALKAEEKACRQCLATNYIIYDSGALLSSSSISRAHLCYSQIMRRGRMLTFCGTHMWTALALPGACWRLRWTELGADPVSPVLGMRSLTIPWIEVVMHC